MEGNSSGKRYLGGLPVFVWNFSSSISAKTTAQKSGIWKFSRLFVTCFQNVGKITKQVEMTKSPECLKGYRVLKKWEPLQNEAEHSGGVQFSNIWDIDFKFARINLDK